MKPFRLAARYATLAFVLHGVFISLSLVPALRAAPLLVGDSVSYYNVAQNLIDHGVISRDTGPPFKWEPHRTPGYPAIIALVEILFGDFRLTLYVAAFTAAAAAFCAVILANDWGGLAAGHVAGTIAALLPNSLGLSAMLLTDAIVGHLTLITFCLVHFGMLRRSQWLMISAFIAVVTLQTIKPTFNAVALLWLIVSTAYRSALKPWWVHAAVIAGLLAVPSYFATRNLRDHGVLTPTLLGVETARNYLQVREEAHRTGHSPSQVFAEFGMSDRAAAARLTEPASLEGRIYVIRRARLRQFVVDHFVSIPALLFSEVLRQLFAPQEFAALVFSPKLSAFSRVFWTLVTVLFLLCSAVGLVCLLRIKLSAPSIVAVAFLGFFLIAGSVSHFVGARLRFPADMTLIPITAVGAVKLGTRARTSKPVDAPNPDGGH